MNVVVGESEVPNTPGFEDLPSDSSDFEVRNTRSGFSTPKRQKFVVVDDESPCSKRFSTPKRQKSVVVDDESPCSMKFKAFCKRVLDRNETEKEKEKMKEKERMHAIEKKMKEQDKKEDELEFLYFMKRRAAAGKT
ncbi:uncharacterized protein LOC141633599 [Silene latifolia]|uniref:uncharacterized protein LOC141633599 n=1 Tax=Silene latifolia TaxID=37657 RepID=UPI003D76DC14